MLNPDPKKYYTLPETVDALGHKRFGDEWTETELSTARPLVDPDRFFRIKWAKRAAFGYDATPGPQEVAREAKERAAYLVKRDALGRLNKIEVKLQRIFFRERVPAVLLGSNGEIFDLAGARWMDDRFLVDFQSGRVEWAGVGLIGIVLIDRHEFDRVVLGQSDQAPADLPIAESPRAKAAPPPSNLTDEARSKGGSRSRHDAGLQKFIDQLSAEFKSRGNRLVLSSLKTWLENNALSPDQSYSPEPFIADCDEIQLIDDRIWWKDRNSNAKNISLRAAERYIARAKRPTSQ